MSEWHGDDSAIFTFSFVMSAKMEKKREVYRNDEWRTLSEAELQTMLNEHVVKGDPVDVAIIAMMIYMNRRAGV